MLFCRPSPLPQFVTCLFCCLVSGFTFCVLPSNSNDNKTYPLTPSAALLHTDLQSLWKQSALLTVLPGHKEKQRGEGEEDKEGPGESEHDREILRTERKRRHSSMSQVGHYEGTTLFLDRAKSERVFVKTVPVITKGIR